MSSPFSYGSQPSVQGWLDGQYEYMVPDKDIDEPTGKPSYIPRDAYRDHNLDYSDETSSRGKDHRSSREKYHSSAKERYTPLSPPPEYDLSRERDEHRRGSGQSSRRNRSQEGGQEERRPRDDRDTRYPPKADHGRRRRPPLKTATTSPYMTAGQPTKDQDAGKPRHRRYSQGSSPPLHLDDKASRNHHSRRHADRSPSPPPQPRHTSNKKDSRDRDTHSHHGSSSSPSSAAKPHRPSLSRSQTAPYDKDPKRPGSSGRSFSFLNDTRFMTAAEAALQAGATAALASGGGKWGKDKGAKVLGAGLSAAALSALKNPAAAGAAPPPPPGPGETAGGKAGRYAAGHVGRREGTKRRYY